MWLRLKRKFSARARRLRAVNRIIDLKLQVGFLCMTQRYAMTSKSCTAESIKDIATSIVKVGKRAKRLQRVVGI